MGFPSKETLGQDYPTLGPERRAFLGWIFAANSDVGATGQILLDRFDDWRTTAALILKEKPPVFWDLHQRLTGMWYKTQKELVKKRSDDLRQENETARQLVRTFIKSSEALPQAPLQMLCDLADAKDKIREARSAFKQSFRWYKEDSEDKRGQALYLYRVLQNAEAPVLPPFYDAGLALRTTSCAIGLRTLDLTGDQVGEVVRKTIQICVTL